MAYDALKAKLMIPFLPFAAALVDYISSILDFHLDLQDHWSDIFILLYLYFFVRGRTYWDYGRKNCAIFRWTWGLITAFFISILCGVVALGNIYSGLYVTSFMLLGITLFETADWMFSASFSRQANLSWFEDSKRYALFAIPQIVIGALSILLGYLVGYLIFSGNREITNVLLLMFFFTANLVYWLFRGWQYAGKAEYKNEGETRMSKFKRSSNTYIGKIMALSMFEALGMISFDAGYFFL